MSRDVTKTGNGVIAVPKISPQLRKLLNHREVVASYGLDAGTDGGGEFRRGPWIKPKWVDIRERNEAQAALPAFVHLAGPAPEQVVIDFLNFLWISTKHSPDQTFESVCMVYPRMLRQFPGYCWRADKLDLAPHAFPIFFPTVGEIAAFLMPDKVWIEEEIAGLHGIAEANINPNAGQEGRGKLRPWAEGGCDDNTRLNREQADREREELIEIMRKRDEEAGRPERPGEWDRLPGEDAHAFIDRIGDKRRKMQDEITKRMKGGMRPKAKGGDKVPPPSPEAMKTAYDTTGIKSHDVRESQPAEAEGTP